MYKTTQVQDEDGHWYWIPNELLLQFNKDLEAITGIEYMDNPDAFDKFNNDYGKYRTGGAPDLVPLIFCCPCPSCQGGGCPFCSGYGVIPK